MLTATLIVTIPFLLSYHLTHSSSPLLLTPLLELVNRYGKSSIISFPFPGWSAPLVYIFLLVIAIRIQISRHKWMIKRRAKALGAEIVPRYPGKWIGNLDLPVIMAKSYFVRYPGQYAIDMYQRLGTTFDHWVLWTSTFHTADPEFVKQMLSGPRWTNFPKGPLFYEKFDDFLGTGIFNSDGANWKHHRVSARPFFARDEISNFSVFEKHTDHLLAAVSHLSKRSTFEHKGRTIPAGTVDFQDLAGRFTIDSASEFLFGACIDSLSDICPPPESPGTGNDSAVSKAGNPEASAFFHSFNQAQENVGMRFNRSVIWRLYELKGNPNAPHIKVINNLLEVIIARALENSGKENPDEELRSNVFLTHLISETRDPKAIRDELLNILLAARDTTASLLSSVVYELSRNKTILHKLREEILGKFGKDIKPEADEVRTLRYLRAVLNEALRLHPSVPYNIRSSTEEDVVEAGGKRYYVPPNTMIAYGLLPMQRRKDLWGEDAEAFDPDRWLDDRIQKMTSNPFIFQPFSAGPRICLGQQFAYNEASFCLVRLLQQYDQITLEPEAYPKGPYAFSALRPFPKGQGPEGKDAEVGEPMRYAAITLTFKEGLWVRFGNTAE